MMKLWRWKRRWVRKNKSKASSKYNSSSKEPTTPLKFSSNNLKYKEPIKCNCPPNCCILTNLFRSTSSPLPPNTTASLNSYNNSALNFREKWARIVNLNSRWRASQSKWPNWPATAEIRWCWQCGKRMPGWKNQIQSWRGIARFWRRMWRRYAAWISATATRTGSTGSPRREITTCAWPLRELPKGWLADSTVIYLCLSLLLQHTIFYYTFEHLSQKISKALFLHGVGDFFRAGTVISYFSWVFKRHRFLFILLKLLLLSFKQAKQAFNLSKKALTWLHRFLHILFTLCSNFLFPIGSVLRVLEILPSYLTLFFHSSQPFLMILHVHTLFTKIYI